MPALAAARPAEIGPTGAATWTLPGSDLRVLWPGPGAGLFVIFRDSLVRVDHRDADDQYASRRDAGRAVARLRAAIVGA